MKLAITLAAAIVLAPSVLMAGGEVYERDLSSTSLGQCDGNLVETISQSGGGQYFHTEVFVACLNSPATKAAWVFLANEGCSFSEKCSRRPKNAPPAFIVTKDFWEARPGPVRVQFELLRYVKGYGCRVWPSKISEVGSVIMQGNYNYEAWICDSFDVYDGVQTDANSKFLPSLSKSFILTNVGSTEPKPSSESKLSSEHTASVVALPEHFYRFDWLREVF